MRILRVYDWQCLNIIWVVGFGHHFPELKMSAHNTFHEISIRYPFSEYEVISAEFENYFKSLGISACSNQIDWPVDKFNLFKVID